MGATGKIQPVSIYFSGRDRRRMVTWRRFGPLAAYNLALLSGVDIRDRRRVRGVNTRGDGGLEVI